MSRRCIFTVAAGRHEALIVGADVRRQSRQHYNSVPTPRAQLSSATRPAPAPITSLSCHPNYPTAPPACSPAVCQAVDLARSSRTLYRSRSCQLSHPGRTSSWLWYGWSHLCPSSSADWSCPPNSPDTPRSHPCLRVKRSLPQPEDPAKQSLPPISSSFLLSWWSQPPLFGPTTQSGISPARSVGIAPVPAIVRAACSGEPRQVVACFQSQTTNCSF
jgi:hypothetical protein